MLPSEHAQTEAPHEHKGPKRSRELFRPMPLLLACLLLACHAVSESRQDEVQSNTNQHININNQQETIKSGNKKTNNFNLQETNYQPTQSTKVVFNVGKYKNQAANKLRRSRPPTIDEYEIKKRIMDVYAYALEDVQAGQRNTIYLEHLGRILRALNPKYISTKRVAYVAFADPRDPEAEQVAPEDELPPPTENIEVDESEQSALAAAATATATAGNHHQEPLALRGDSELSLQEQLDLMSERVKEAAVWDRDFVRKLFRVPDRDFTPNQLAYKRFLQCMTYPLFCKQQMIVKKKEANDADPLLPVVSASGEPDQLAVASETQPQVMMYLPNGDPNRPQETQSLEGEQQSEVVYGPHPQPQQQQQQQREQQPLQHQQHQHQHQQKPQQPAQEWQHQQTPVSQQPQTRFHRKWQKRAMAAPPPQPQSQSQSPRRYREQQQVNYKVATPDVNLPQKLLQQYAPEYQEQMRRMDRIRGGGHHRHHK